MAAMSDVESPPRAPAWEWVQSVLLAGNLGWTTLCLGGYRPETMAVTLALTGLLLAVHLTGWGWQRGRLHPAGWWLLPFLVYAAANVLWVTPVPWLGWLDWFGWFNLLAVFWVVLNGLRSSGPRRLLLGLLIGIALGSVLLACYQRFVDPKWLMLGRTQAGQYQGRASGSFGIPNSLAAFLLLLLPALGALTFRRAASSLERVWWGWCALVLGLGFVLTISRGGWIALALALGLWPLLGARGSWRRRLGFSAVAIAAAVILGGMLIALLPTTRERFVGLVREAGERSRPVMWRASWQLFQAAPVWGSGAGSYNVLFERHRPERFPDEPQWAHNEYLNTLGDYGIVGFVLFFGGAGVIGWRVMRRRDRDSVTKIGHGDWNDDPIVASALGVGLVAFAFQLTLDFHFKIPALAMACAVVAGLVVSRTPGSDVTSGSVNPARRKVVAVALAVATVGAIGFGGVPRIHGEALRYRARQQIDQLALSPPEPAGYRSRLAAAREDLREATRWEPQNGQSWADLSYATSLWAHIEPNRTTELGREAEAEANRALALSLVNPDFWVRRGVSRDMQGRWLEAGDDFTKATTVAPQNALIWYYYADHLSRKRTERAMTDAALAFCLRLDPLNGPGLAFRQRLAISRSAP